VNCLYHLKFWLEKNMTRDYIYLHEDFDYMDQLPHSLGYHDYEMVGLCLGNQNQTNPEKLYWNKTIIPVLREYLKSENVLGLVDEYIGGGNAQEFLNRILKR